MLLCNAIFRAGGAACLLTTGSGDGAKKNKYRLVADERTHLGRDDAAFRCMGQAFDGASGSLGVFLRKNVGEVAAKAVRLNLERLGPRALPPGPPAAPPTFSPRSPLPLPLPLPAKTRNSESPTSPTSSARSRRSTLTRAGPRSSTRCRRRCG